jgi:hypothetical protein
LLPIDRVGAGALSRPWVSINRPDACGLGLIVRPAMCCQ